MGFLIVRQHPGVILGCFIDFFEDRVHRDPELAPVADKRAAGAAARRHAAGLGMIWFGVIIAMKPADLVPDAAFGLCAVLPPRRWAPPPRNGLQRTPHSGETIPAVTTRADLQGAIAFICIQLIMVVAVVVFPGLVIDHGDEEGDRPRLDPAPARGADRWLRSEQAGARSAKDLAPGSAAPPAADVRGRQAADDDPMAAMKREMERDLKK